MGEGNPVLDICDHLTLEDTAFPNKGNYGN